MPFSWQTDEGLEHAVVLILTKSNVDYDNDDLDTSYTITLINTGGDEVWKGLDYHPLTVDPSLGHTKRMLSIEFTNVPQEKIDNASYWVLIFRSVVYPKVRSDAENKDPKYIVKCDSEYVYERLLPWLIDRPIIAAVDMEEDFEAAHYDFVDVPHGGDSSYVNLIMESFRCIGRKAGLSRTESMHLPALIKSAFLKVIINDLKVTKTLKLQDADLIKLAVRDACTIVGRQSVLPDPDGEGKPVAEGDMPHTTLSPGQLVDTISMIETIESVVAQKCESSILTYPKMEQGPEERLKEIGDWMWFGRYDIALLYPTIPYYSLLYPTIPCYSLLFSYYSLTISYYSLLLSTIPLLFLYYSLTIPLIFPYYPPTIPLLFPTKGCVGTPQWRD